MINHQIGVMLYRTMCFRKIADVKRELENAILEVTALIRKAVALDVTQYIPPFL